MFLYLGDDDITRAAAYLSGVLTHFNIPFERVDSSASPPDDFTAKKYTGYIISDYPAKQFRPGQMEHIRQSVANGAGLLMLGGWESFHGQYGEYNNSPLAEVLPVEMQDTDDRRNCPQPVLLYKRREHPILAGLPWDRAPFIGGFNQFIAKSGTVVLLKGICTKFSIVAERVADWTTDSVLLSDSKPLESRLSFALPDGSASCFLTLTEEHPVLVTSIYGTGKTAALATDVAPHWAGNFVDWGKQRIVQELPGGAGTVEFGADYGKFFAQLVQWLK
ncbi:MAG: glutamine amidotransferase [Planctomycetaceae bacterium]|jgi:hypothetical protein|nr:glutamine amidotransferase [Planctomycetaceae bacterium]